MESQNSREKIKDIAEDIINIAKDGGILSALITYKADDISSEDHDEIKEVIAYCYNKINNDFRDVVKKFSEINSQEFEDDLTTYNILLLMLETLSKSHREESGNLSKILGDEYEQTIKCIKHPKVRVQEKKNGK